LKKQKIFCVLIEISETINFVSKKNFQLKGLIGNGLVDEELNEKKLGSFVKKAFYSLENNF
jgi:hypothetical protein